MSADKITTILFDVGGVIVVPLNPVANAERRNHLASRLGFDSGDQMWDHFFESETWTAAKTGKLVYTEMWEALLTPLGLSASSDRDDFLAQLYADEGILPGMRALIEALHGIYRLGILSNWDDRLEEILEEKLDIAHFFDVILNSHRIGVAKPDRGAFLLALERLEAQPHEVLFVDDLPRNTKVAGEMGLHTHVYRGLPTLVNYLKEQGILDATHGLEHG